MFNKTEYSHQYYQLHKEKRKEYSRQYTQNHREECRLQHKKVNAALKLVILTHYSLSAPPSCSRCGLTDIDILTIDHINGGGNEHRRQIALLGSSNLYRWLQNNNFPLGFQVLCFNCNVKKRMVGEH